MAADTDALQVLFTQTHPDYVAVTVSVDCSNLQVADGGIRLRPRERFELRLPRRFPFEIPKVLTRHTRWAGQPHVQWARELCLYASPSVEWNPARGIAGYVERLMLWLERAAAGHLDAPGAPLHPPVAYPSNTAGVVIVHADAPRADGDEPWLGVALLRRVHSERVDLVGWRELTEAWPSTSQQARQMTGTSDTDAEMALALAVILPGPIAFEHPDTARDLIGHLSAYGVSDDVLLGCLGAVAHANTRLSTRQTSDVDADHMAPLYVVVGTPTRGVVGEEERLTHIEVWRLPALGEQIARLSAWRFSSRADLAELGQRVVDIGKLWLQTAGLAWARVYETRPQIVTRRDATTPASWLFDKSILVLGAGALGAPIAEACVRGGARRVQIADKSVVHPGILVRQPYYDAEIGLPKAKVLAERLYRIAPDTTVGYWCTDVAVAFFDAAQPPPGFDLIIDATADRTVRAVLERCRATHRAAWPAVATVVIGHDATRGIATLSYPGASGGGADILRRVGLAARADTTSTLADLVDDFFPDPPPNNLFRPEPGCSDATFVGSAPQVAGLAGQLLDGVLAALSAQAGKAAMLALITRMPALPGKQPPASPVWLRWPNDTILRTADGRHEVRLAPCAQAEMRAEARRGARLRGPKVETGGCLLGAFDPSADVIWIDEASGPPPDSLLSEVHFQHGTEGVAALLDVRRAATARVTGFVGLWHSHPHGRAHPSPTDEYGMRQLVLPIAAAPPQALMLIVGGESAHWDAWLADGSTPQLYGRVIERAHSDTAATHDHPAPPVLDTASPQWPGGYATSTANTPSLPATRRRRWRSRWRRGRG